MDQLISASLSHTHYWYEVGMLKAPAAIEERLIERRAADATKKAKRRKRNKNVRERGNKMASFDKKKKKRCPEEYPAVIMGAVANQSDTTSGYSSALSANISTSSSLYIIYGHHIL